MESIVENPQILDDFVMDYDDFSDFPDEAAHFFDDPPSSRGHTDIRSHLEDLAQRHPEFADHLRYPAWTDEPKTNTWGRKRRGSQEQEEVSKQQNKEEKEESPRGRAKENLRNTVPDMGQKQQQSEEKQSERGQRSWSAPPPDSRNEKPRFVSKIEIHPVNPDAKPQQPQQSSSTGDATKPPMAPPKPQPPPQANQPQHKTSTVRHIPIFVEGRDEPLLPRGEPEFTQHAAPQTHYAPPPHPQRKQTPPRFEGQPRFEKEVPIQTRFEKEVPIQPRFEKEVPVQAGPRFEKEVPIQTRFEQQHQNPQQQQHAQPEPQQPQVNPNDPLYRVECVQKEVDELKTKIENFNGTSRKDKEYIYLDEMLTRNLIKLDNVETEGREEVRVARKNTIKSIQNCISLLENKVPLPSEQQTEMKEEGEGEKVEEKMETEQSSGDGQQPAAETKPEPEQSGEKPMEVESEKTAGGDATTETASEQPSAAEEKKEENKEVNESVSNEASENKSPA